MRARIQVPYLESETSPRPVYISLSRLAIGLAQPERDLERDQDYYDFPQDGSTLNLIGYGQENLPD